MANLKQNNDMAVSPIVATLVLIVVAVIGAVAVGTIMGTFSTDVSKQASAGNVAGASQTDIIVTGSSTLYPAALATAKEYVKANPAINVKVSSTGSGAGLAAVTQGVADIGMMSEDLTATQKAAYPDVNTYQVGVSGVVVIQKATGTLADASLADLRTIYETGAAPAAGTLSTVTGAITRSDKSGTADTFGKLIGLAADDIYKNPGFVTKQKGNGDVVKTIKAAATAPTVIAFTDYDYVRNDADVRMINYAGFTNPTLSSIKAAWNKEAGATFPSAATRPVNFVVNGQPSSIAKDYITFNQMPSSKAIYNDIGIVHISELVVS